MVLKSQALRSKQDIVANYRVIIKVNHKIARVVYHRKATLKRRDSLIMLLKIVSTEWRKMLSRIFLKRKRSKERDTMHQSPLIHQQTQQIQIAKSLIIMDSLDKINILILNQHFMYQENPS